MSEDETKVKVDEPQMNAQEIIMRFAENIFPPQRSEEKRRVRIKEEHDSDDEEATEEETDSDDSELDEDEEWETLRDLVESHRKLCQAFSLLLESKKRD